MKKSTQKSTYPLLESIGVWHGATPYLSYHQKRVNATFDQLYPDQTPFDLYDILSQIDFPKGKIKLRFLYNKKEFSTEYQKYERKSINSLYILEDDTIRYQFKYTDRDRLEKLYHKRGKCGDILIFKNGLLTDSYYANVVCIRANELLTPAIPLLKGTMRDFLLEQKIIKQAEITTDILMNSKGVFLINALNPLSTAPFVPVERIFN